MSGLKILFPALMVLGAAGSLVVNLLNGTVDEEYGMTDYISRKELNKRLSEKASRSSHSDFQPAPTWNEAVEIMDSIPAADVRPVVTCKDCVHFVRGELFGDMVCDYHYLHHYHAEPNEFCSHAEKREKS